MMRPDDYPETNAFLRQAHEHINIDGIQIAYRRYGKGPVLLMLHGWPLNGDTFADLAATLSEQYCCIVPDLPGAGQTRWSTEHDLSPAGQAHLLQQFLVQLGIETLCLLGNDSGGIIARYLACSLKRRVRKLVLLNTEIPYHRAPNQRLYKFLARWLPGYATIASIQLRSKSYLRSRAGFGGTLYDHELLVGSFNRRFILALTQSASRMDEARRSFIALLNWQQLDQLHTMHCEIEADTTLIWGRQDETFPEQKAREMGRSFKTSTFVSVDKAKLYVHEDQPEIVANTIASFLQRSG